MTCQTCGQPATFVPQYQQHYCQACQQYVGAAPRKGVNLWLVIGLPVAAVVLIIGVLVWQSVSSFKRYVDKSRTSESREFLHAIEHGARAYFLTEHASSDSMTAVGYQLPAPSVGPTPPLGTCCANGGRCDPDPSYWDDPVWRALDFDISTPHYYSYAYTVSDDGSEYTVSAYGDLDCDESYSTFTLSGRVTGYELQSSGAIMRKDELE